MRISDWSSDVCSSDLRPIGMPRFGGDIAGEEAALHREARRLPQRGDERRRLIEPARVDESLGGGLELLRGLLAAAGAVIAVGRRLFGGGGGADSRHQRRRHGGRPSPPRSAQTLVGEESVSVCRSRCASSPIKKK